MYSLLPDAEGRKARSMGIHSVGMKPIGSTMPCCAALRVNLSVSITARVADGVGHVQPAAVAVDGQSSGSAPSSFGRADAYRSNLHGKVAMGFSGPHIHGCHGVAIRQRNIERLLIRENSNAQGCVPGAIRLDGLSNASLRPLSRR